MKEILITSSALILVVLLLRWLLRGKVKQRLLYAAWLLVALRLLVPVQFGQWSFSLNNLTETVTQHSPAIQQAQQVWNTPVSEALSKEEVRQELTQRYESQGLDLKAPEVQVQLETQVDATYESQTSAPTLSEILGAVWLVGMGVMVLWFAVTNLIFIRRGKAHSSVLEVDAPVEVRVSAGVPTPCVVGLFRPVIYVTPECGEDPQMLRHVLTHEAAHLRQWDPVWSLVRCICLCIYWFDPLVWIAAAQSRRDCELSCDEAALKQLGDEERIPYGKTLLAMIRRSSAPSELLKTATSMNESKRQLKERMCFIVKKPRNLLIAAIAMVLVIALAAGCAFTGSTEPESSQTDSQATEQTDPTDTTPASTEPSEETTDPTVETSEPIDTDYIPDPPSLFPAPTPIVQTEGPSEAQQIAEQAIFTYRTYWTIGVCCEMERSDEFPDGRTDMSEYLTEAQKEEYFNCQYRITCCKTIEEVHAHIDRYIGKDMQHDGTDEELFTDDKGNLYVKVLPTSYDSYRHFDVLSQTKNTIVCRACMYFEPECDDSVIFTLKAGKDGYLVTDREWDREYECETTLLYGNENYQIYQHGDTGFSGELTDVKCGTVHFQENYYCPSVTRISQSIWEIATDYGNGHIKRRYYNLHNFNHKAVYDFAIALGHKKIAHLEGDLENRSLVVCNLFDQSAAQVFTELDFQAVNMPVVSASFADNDTQLTLTYLTASGQEATVTLEIAP